MTSVYLVFVQYTPMASAFPKHVVIMLKTVLRPMRIVEVIATSRVTRASVAHLPKIAKVGFVFKPCVTKRLAEITCEMAQRVTQTVVVLPARLA
jgi:hypothetical protein